jgi:phage baseplate assembly protein gpV
MNALEEMAFRVTELERRLGNLLRGGSIIATDFATARVKVRSGDLVTGWLPWLTHRAGGDVTWHAPEIGEQVMILSPDGEPAQGVVLPAIYSTAVSAPANSADRSVITYQGGLLRFEADREAGVFRLIGNVELVGDVAIEGTVNVSEDVIAGGNDVSLVNHVHGGVSVGASETDVPS